MLLASQALNLLRRMEDEGEKAERERRGRSHSRRLAILAVLPQDGGKLTAAQIRAELPDNPPLGDVKYHLRVLDKTRLVSEDDGLYSLP